MESTLHRLRLGYCLLALLVLAAVVATLAVGGRPDPAGPARLLYGTWRFHAGDDPEWADPRFDDTRWDRPVLSSTPDTRDGDVGLPGLLDGWRARGYQHLEGYGWYRVRVQLPATGEMALLGPTMVNDGYQMYWNGRLIGGVGTFGEHPRVIAARPFLAPLPRAHDERSGVLAVRTFMEPGFGRDDHSGGLRSVPAVAPADFAERLHAAQWHRTIAGYIVEAALFAMMTVLALIALLLAPRFRRPAFAHWLAIALVSTGFLRLGNALAAWTDVFAVSPLVWLNAILLSPLATLAWTLTWNNWAEGRDRRPVYAGAIAAWAMKVAGTVTHTDSVGYAGHMTSLALFVVIAARIARRGEHRWLALSAMVSISIGLFISEITDLGVPDIWFPFGIGVTLTQYAYALALPLICLLVTAADSSQGTMEFTRDA